MSESKHLKQPVPFETETEKLLQMMIHSVYTKKEVFLRELISNASDAIDKRYIGALENPGGNIGPLTRESYSIRMAINKEKRLLSVSDNGIGMDEEELKKYLGTIALSGSSEFREASSQKDAEELIGQFGIGFYSLFMVADRVSVVSRKPGKEEAYVFQSDGTTGYKIFKGSRKEPGTDVILHIREEKDAEKDTYDRYLRPYTLYKLVKEYSDYVRWPILLNMPTLVPDEKGNPSEKWGWEQLNSMVPLWKRNANEVKPEDYEAYFNEHFGKKLDVHAGKKEQFRKPLKVITGHADGKVRMDYILYIPSVSWNTFDTNDDYPGLELYSSGVKIMDACEELLTDEFAFVKGVADCPDLPLNISRESVQPEGVLRSMRDVLVRKIQRSLEDLMKNDRERYEVFWNDFGRTVLVEALDEDNPRHEALRGLLLFESSRDAKTKTGLEEYISRMKPGQNAIYYAKGKSRDEIMKLPETERARTVGAEFLCFEGPAEGLVPEILGSYRDHPFISLTDGTPEDFLKTDAGKDENAEEFLAFVRGILKEDADEVIASKRLDSSPVVLTSGNGITFEMEEGLRKMNPELHAKAKKVLELNLRHPAVKKIDEIRRKEPDKAGKLVRILYNQARLTAGLGIEDMNAYTELLCSLWTE